MPRGLYVRLINNDTANIALKYLDFKYHSWLELAVKMRQE